MEKEDIVYAGTNIPSELRTFFDSLSRDERMNSVLLITIANNARKAASIPVLTAEEIMSIIQGFNNKIPILSSPNTKYTHDASRFKTPLALKSNPELTEQINKYTQLRNNDTNIQNYYDTVVSKFDMKLIEASQTPEFGLSNGKYSTIQCHPMNSFVKKIKNEVNKARYMDERATSFLYKAGEYFKDIEEN